VTPAQLVGHRIWMPGITAGTEWAAYYDDLVAEFGLTIEATGPNLGADALLDTVADTPALATLRAHPPGLARQPRPATHRGDRPHPGLPHSLLWAPRQPPPRPGCPARPPRRHEDRPRQPRHLDAELGVPDVGTG
jgi:hypothetical protein